MRISSAMASLWQLQVVSRIIIGVYWGDMHNICATCLLSAVTSKTLQSMDWNSNALASRKFGDLAS